MWMTRMKVRSADGNAFDRRRLRRNQQTRKEAKEADEFANTDPKDKGNRKVKYRDHKDVTKEDKQQDWLYLMARTASGDGVRRRKPKRFGSGCEMGMEWDKKRKTWKLKGEKEEE